MRKIKLLAVGNSFSEDALAFLHQVAKAGGVDLETVNLYIGGCSLQRHYENLKSGARDYMYQRNGCPSQRYVSVQEVIKEEKWDYICTQQASHDSGLWETYFPYLGELTDYFKKECPTAQCLLHQTWSYETDSGHEAFGRYHNSQQEMYEKLTECYEKAARLTGLRLIPSGFAVQMLRKLPPFRYEMGERSICRDGYHMDLIYGRYLLAAVIYTFLFQKDIRDNSFVPEGGQEEVLNVIKKCVHGILS